MKHRYVEYQSLINSLLKEYFKLNNKRFLVLIGGCSRSGKTTLASKIKVDCDKINIKCIIVSLDNWLLGLDERKGDETVRERFKYGDIVEAIKRMMNGDTVYAPLYDPRTRLIISEKNPEPLRIEEGICIVDGVVALDISELRKHADFNIYTDVYDPTRIKRLVSFYTEYKKCSMEDTRKIIASRELDEVSIIKKTKRYADVIYMSEKSGTDEIDNQLSQLLKTGLKHETN